MQKSSRLFWFLWGVASALLGCTGVASNAYAEDCEAGSVRIAAANAASEAALPLNLFGRPEKGWAFYEPLMDAEIGTECTAGTAGFARALAAWQSAHGLAATGLVNEATLARMKAVWQGRRSFVIKSHHHCPDPPADTILARALPSESYGGKVILLRTDALAAYRAAAAAATQQGLLPPRSHLMAIFSAYRSPDYDAARCATQHNCQGVVRASCSAHRTGYAMDLYLGAAPGFSPDSSADPNRLYISQSALYRWLVRNGPRFGLVNYPFEPWHWEFVGSGASR